MKTLLIMILHCMGCDGLWFGRTLLGVYEISHSRGIMSVLTAVITFNFKQLLLDLYFNEQPGLLVAVLCNVCMCGNRMTHISM